MKILLAIDESRCSEAALAEVARVMWPPQSDIQVVTVVTPVDPGLLRGSPSTVFDEIVEQQRAESGTRLHNAAAVLAQSVPGPHVTAALLEGRPGYAIVTEAERWGADLVVVGSHGCSSIRRFFLGSVSLFVAHNAPCSVLVVRRPAEFSPPANRPTAAVS